MNTLGNFDAVIVDTQELKTNGWAWIYNNPGFRLELGKDGDCHNVISQTALATLDVTIAHVEDRYGPGYRTKVKITDEQYNLLKENTFIYVYEGVRTYRLYV